MNQTDGTTEVQTCILHESANAKQNVGPSLNVHGSAQDDVPKSTYGPLIMVMCKKLGIKQQRGDGTTMNLHGQPRAGKETQSYMPLGSEFLNTGPSGILRESSRPRELLMGFKWLMQSSAW